MLEQARSEGFRTPILTKREYYALHAPPAPDWWKVRDPLDRALWCWTWADAMLRSQGWPTDIKSARVPPRPKEE